jgi:hypothetical protein
MLGHIASAIRLRGDPRRFLIAVFTAYFDASGHPSSGTTFFVSGFASSEKKWLLFEGEWAALLARYAITPPFHMKEFAPAVGQYAAWKDDKARRKAFLGEAVKLLKRRTHKSFSSGVILEDLRRINREYVMPSHMAFPYCLCGQQVLAKVALWLYHRKLGGHIAVVFEDGDTHKGKLLDLMHSRGIRIPVAFMPKDGSAALQAADLVAWEHRRFATDMLSVRETGKGKRLRGSLEALRIQLPHEDSWGVYDRKALLDHCVKHNYRRR